VNQIDITTIKNIHDIQTAESYLYGKIKVDDTTLQALNFSKKLHVNQSRKSGEPYVVHPILVSAIVASITGDLAMVQAALLHDVVEDTEVSIDEIESLFGKDVAHLVGGLTKIDNIRDNNLIPSYSDEKLIVSALSFRKMLLASIDDVRVLVVKLCDRLHNMLTLDALPEHKQHRIAEETLVVYAPVAHRLGISFLKNLLEDLSFGYLFKTEKKEIQNYLDTNYHAITIKLNAFEDKMSTLLLKNGFCSDDFEILTRVKHNYSIYLKMQRKGISIDEILDLLAIRILVKNPVDCYKVLGLVHLNFKPLSSRFKDYIAIPKDNGYETLHTTIFDETSILEVQIRTTEMHKTAELGVAAHWKYKSGGNNNISLDWLNNLQFQNESVEDFYELIKNDLYSEDISVFSPTGEAFTLPRGAVALDFAYSVHTQVGNRADGCLINKEKSSLLSELNNGDIVRIVTNSEDIPRCSWIDAVKTSRAKTNLRANCKSRMKQTDQESGVNILATVMGLKNSRIEAWFAFHLETSCSKIPLEVDHLREMIHKYSDDIRKENRFRGFLSRHRFKLKSYTFGGLEIFSNYSVSDIVYDYCCHPKSGDQLVAFFENSKAHVHHKMCKNAMEKIDSGEKMLFVHWNHQKNYHYHLIISMPNAQGALANFLTYFAKIGMDILSIKLGQEKSDHIQLCEIECQTLEDDLLKLRSKVEQKSRVIQFIRTDDAYRTL
jgi:GTP pyrophosphokinase